MKKTLSLFLFVVLAWPLSVFGELSDDVRSLKDVGFSVVVEDINAEAEKAGFSQREYKNAVELRLRSLGIEISEEPVPYLYLNVTPIRVNSNAFALSIDLDFKQSVLLFRKPTVVTTNVVAPTWSEGSVATVGENRIDGAVKGWVIQLVDRFANDYLKANPPEPRSGQGDE